MVDVAIIGAGQTKYGNHQSGMKGMWAEAALNAFDSVDKDFEPNIIDGYTIAVREFEAKKDTFMIKEIKLLVLSNGTTVVRDKKTIRMICSGIFIYFIYYLSLLDISEIFN